jgi:hypothetical protein
MSNPISTWNESPLHAALKEWVALPGDQFEVAVDGFIVDIVRDDLLIEIQTSSFASIRDKLLALVQNHPVRLVYPVAEQKWIVKLPKRGDGKEPGSPSRRKSPKRGTFEDVFRELVSFPQLIAHDNFSLDILLIQEEELRRYDGRRGWRRRGWVIHERRLLEVVNKRRFASPVDMAELLPASLVQPFTTSHLARAIGKPRRLAQRMTYCLRKMGAIQAVGKEGNAFLYTLVDRTEAS